MSFHSDLTVSDGIHIPFSWIWADSSERTSQVVTGDDVYKLGLQEDTQTAYLLIDITPTWVAILATATTINLDDLADVDTTGVTNGQAILYNAGTWEAGDVATELSDLSDVNTAGVTDGQVLIYDSGSGDWIPGNASSNDHTVSDAVTDTLSDAVVLAHNSSGTPVDGFGTSILFQADDDTTPDQNIGRIGWSWNDATTATRRSEMRLIGHNQWGAFELGVIVSPTTNTLAPTGNARGIGAVDLQSGRDDIADVASGNYSTLVAGYGSSNAGNFSGILAGRRNLIDVNSAYVGIVAGKFNSVSYSYSSFVTGSTNTINGMSYGAVIGNGNQAVGGFYNTIIGRDSSIYGGSNYSSILGGYNNNIDNSDYSSILGGKGQSLVNSDLSFIGSGLNNSITDPTATTLSIRSAICSGTGNVITYNSSSFIGAGINNVMLGTQGGSNVIGSGSANSITNGLRSTILNGNSNVIDSLSPYSTITGSTILGGGNNVINSDNTVVLTGNNCKPTLKGQIASNTGIFSVDGDAQGSLQLIARREVIHSDTNSYELFLDGATERITIQNNQTMTIEGVVVGATSGLTENWNFHFIAAVKNDAGTTTILGSPVITEVYKSNVNFSLSITADDINDVLVISVSDSSSSGLTVRWVATLKTVELIYS